MTTDNTQSGSDTNVTRKDTPTEVVTSKIKGTQAEQSAKIAHSTQAELDEILDAFASGEVSPHWKDNRKTYTKPEAKQAITSLIKELVEEAKPGTWVDPEDTDDLEWQGYVKGVSDFEQNLLKALEEV